MIPVMFIVIPILSKKICFLLKCHDWLFPKTHKHNDFKSIFYSDMSDFICIRDGQSILSTDLVSNFFFLQMKAGNLSAQVSLKYCTMTNG